MSATKPAKLTLAIQKATEGFTVIVDRPMENDFIGIRQLLVPFLMKTTYNIISWGLFYLPRVMNRYTRMGLM